MVPCYPPKIPIHFLQHKALIYFLCLIGERGPHVLQWNRTRTGGRGGITRFRATSEKTSDTHSVEQRIDCMQIRCRMKIYANKIHFIFKTTVCADNARFFLIHIGINE